MAPGFIVAIALASAAPAAADEGYVADVRAATYVQVYRRALLPGADGVVVQPETVAALYGHAFLRVTGLDAPWAKDALSAELSVWGALGQLDAPAGAGADGDLQAAWVQHATRSTRVRLGRQVTLPGAARYVRFDGVSAGVRVGPVDAAAYVGLVSLARFVRPRGYHVLGTVGDALKDPTLLELQSRPGQWLAGAQLSWVGSAAIRASLGFHEQRGAEGVAYRNLAADLYAAPGLLRAGLGGRVVFDLLALAPAEARLFVDVTALEKLPLSVDYVYAAPALLLQHTSVLVAFGGASWHELGADATFRPTPWFRLVGRAAGQLYTTGQPGARASLRALWTPDVDERWHLVAEYGRVTTPDNGYHHLRAAVRFQAAVDFAATVDGGAYFYDFAVRETRASAVGVFNLEYALGQHFKVLVSGSLATTPFAKFDAQGLVRLVYELDGPSAGGGT